MRKPVSLSAAAPLPGETRAGSRFKLVRLPGVPAFGMENEAGAYLYQQVSIDTYLAHDIRSFGKTGPFRHTVSRPRQWLVIAVAGNWQIDGAQRIALPEGGIALFRAAGFRFYTMGETDGQIVFVEQLRPGSEPVTPLLFPLIVPAGAKSDILQIIRSSFFPAPVALHGEIIRTLYRCIPFWIGIQEAQGGLPDESETAVLIEVKALLDQELYAMHSADVLATRFGISKTKLVQGFRQLYGRTPHDYCVNKKLEAARLMLEDTGKPIKLVARKAGYRNTSNFTIAFKRRFGVTPGQVRKDPA